MWKRVPMWIAATFCIEIIRANESMNYYLPRARTLVSKIWIWFERPLRVFSFYLHTRVVSSQTGNGTRKRCDIIPWGLRLSTNNVTTNINQNEFDIFVSLIESIAVWWSVISLGTKMNWTTENRRKRGRNVAPAWINWNPVTFNETCRFQLTKPPANLPFCPLLGATSDAVMTVNTNSMLTAVNAVKWKLYVHNVCSRVDCTLFARSYFGKKN